MKKLLVISVASALTALTMTACNDRNAGVYYEYPYIVSLAETTDGVTTTTTYEWNDETRAQTGETQRRGSSIVYETSGFVTGANTVTRNRTTYNEDGTTTIYKLVSTYGSTGLETMFQMSNGTTLVESKQTVFNSNDEILRYEELKANGEAILRKDYSYDGMKGSRPYYTFTESRNGETPVSMLFQVTELYDSAYVVGYEVRYNGADGPIIEKMSNFNMNSNGTEESYNITKYDNEGNNPVVTNVVKKYKLIKINY